MADRSGENQTDVIARPLEEVRRARGEEKVAVMRSKVATLRAFRRVWPDRIFGIFGVLLIVVASGLIFGWEKKSVVEPKVGLTWREDAHSIAFQNFTLTEGQPTRQYSFDVVDVNVTRVVVTAFWIDDVAQEGVDVDNFTIEITGPPGTNVSATDRWITCCLGSAANKTYPFRVQDAPDAPSQFPAETVAEAEAQLGDRTQRVGTGTWKVTVTLNQANDHYENNLARSQPCPANSPPAVCTPDNGNWVRVGLDYSTYRPDFKVV